MIAVLLIQCLHLCSIESVQAVNRARSFSGKQSPSLFFNILGISFLAFSKAFLQYSSARDLHIAIFYTSALILHVPCINNINDTMVNMEVYYFCEKIVSVVKCVHNFHFSGD